MIHIHNYSYHLRFYEMLGFIFLKKTLLGVCAYCNCYGHFCNDPDDYIHDLHQLFLESTPTTEERTVGTAVRTVTTAVRTVTTTVTTITTSVSTNQVKESYSSYYSQALLHLQIFGSYFFTFSHTFALWLNNGLINCLSRKQ